MNRDQLSSLGGQLAGVKQKSASGASGIGSSSRFGKVLNRFVIPFVQTDTSKSFDITAVKDIQRLSVRVATRVPQDSSSGIILSTGDEVFPFMGTPTTAAVISIGRANTTINTGISISPTTGNISLTLESSSSFDTGIIILTEYDFDYTFLKTVTYNTSGTAGFANFALNEEIRNLDNVFVSNYAAFGDTATYQMAFNGTFQPSGYYPDTSNFMDIPVLWHIGSANYYSSGGYFIDKSTYRLYQDLFMGTKSFQGKIFEIKAKR